jgi:beta-hydroxyacyl-ACP dehydratase FabZ
MLDAQEIQRLLPHRYPFLLVDRVLGLEKGKRITGIKNVSINEAFFQGHFPGEPIMPGVLIIEAMAQVAGILAVKSQEDNLDISRKIVYFTSIDRARFRKPVLPGDQVQFEIEILQVRAPYWKFRGVALVKGEKVCDAELMAMLQDK